MSELTHEKDFRAALQRIDILCRGKQHSDGVLIGRIMEIAQAALSNAGAADKIVSAIQDGSMSPQPTSAFKVMADHFGIPTRP